VSKAFNFIDLPTVTEELLDSLSYFSGDKPIIKTKFFRGGTIPILIITGENATGKSFMRKLYCTVFKQNKIECMPISQQGRCTGGIMRVFVYGDESCESTGYNSSKTVTTGINTCNSRDKKHAIIWDEPDLGLSDGYAAGIGIEIKEFVNKLSKNTMAVIITTHSKYLIKELLPLNPHHLRLGDKKSLKRWMNERVVPKDLKELEERSHKTWSRGY